MKQFDKLEASIWF